VLFRSQQGVAISFLEDVWTHNLLNIFVAPVRTAEYVAATCLVGVLRVSFTLLLLGVLASFAYGFNILSLWPSLLPFLGALMLFGWALGMVSTALIMRWGQAAEGLAWAVPFFIQPLAAVFYPLDALPPWLQHVAEALPAAHIFEGMRQVLVTGGIPWEHLQRALLLDGLWFLLAALFYAMTLAHVRRSGLLVKVATH
jgi:ABC-2 type transport system permease protein